MVSHGSKCSLLQGENCLARAIRLVELTARKLCTSKTWVGKACLASSEQRQHLKDTHRHSFHRRNPIPKKKTLRTPGFGATPQDEEESCISILPSKKRTRPIEARTANTENATFVGKMQRVDKETFQTAAESSRSSSSSSTSLGAVVPKGNKIQMEVVKQMPTSSSSSSSAQSSSSSSSTAQLEVLGGGHTEMESKLGQMHKQRSRRGFTARTTITKRSFGQLCRRRHFLQGRSRVRANAPTEEQPRLVRLSVFWGYACWSRCQLMGEIARGSWGLCQATVRDIVLAKASTLWQQVRPRLMFAPKTVMSESYDGNAPEDEMRRESLQMAIWHDIFRHLQSSVRPPWNISEDSDEDEGTDE